MAGGLQSILKTLKLSSYQLITNQRTMGRNHPRKGRLPIRRSMKKAVAVIGDNIRSMTHCARSVL